MRKFPVMGTDPCVGQLMYDSPDLVFIIFATAQTDFPVRFKTLPKVILACPLCPLPALPQIPKEFPLQLFETPKKKKYKKQNLG